MTAVHVIWPEHIGVEGLSTWAARSPHDDASAGRAVAALREWLPALDVNTDALGPSGLAGLAGLVEAMRPDRFPYLEVLEHYRRVGRTHAADEVTRRLRHLNDVLRQPVLTGGRGMWPLPEWLPSTVDQRTGNYDSYLVADLLDSITDAGEPRQAGTERDDRSDAEVENDTDRAIDMLIAALAADLAVIEASAVRSGRESRQQRIRTQACLLVLSKLTGLAPKWAQHSSLAIDAEATTTNRADVGRLAEATSDLAMEVRNRLPQPCRLAVELSLLPTTRLHDEQMFIRGIQIFETLYRQVYRCLVRASAAMQVMDLRRACAELADATGRLGLSPALYRVVTTMPRGTFATIREYTNGRSAIQSRSYRQIDLVCAPRQASPVADKLPAVDVPSPTLQEAFVAVAAKADAAEVDRLARQMRALDASWRAMKRTHWGITLKIIGRVPGTGGTTGAEYLKRAAEIPLFPVLAEAAL